ncbi:MAG: hypothetical protein ABI609_10995 [Acidobacteriota bacterium]
MKTPRSAALASRILVASVIALAVSVGAQTTPPPGAAPAAKPAAAPMTGHPMDSAKHDTDLKGECQRMMANKQEMQTKLEAMDATLDKLVAEMNAAKRSKEMDTMERSMAAVITELVAQRKTTRSMMMAMQPEMMAHMMHHTSGHGMKSAMDCPMMKSGSVPDPKAGENMPKM